MLKFKIDSDSFDKLNDVEKTFYAMSGDGYQFQMEGAVSVDEFNNQKQKTDEFRENNVGMMKKFGDIDLDEVNELRAQKRKLLDAEFIDKKDFDGMKNEHYKSADADWSAKYGNLESKYNDLMQTNNKNISKYEIEGAATKAFGEHKINPEAYDSVMAQIKSKFSIDNGRVIARDGDSILAGADGNLTVSEFVASQPEIFKIQSTGGNAKGNEAPTNVPNSTAKRDAYAKLLG